MLHISYPTKKKNDSAVGIDHRAQEIPDEYPRGHSQQTHHHNCIEDKYHSTGILAQHRRTTLQWFQHASRPEKANSTKELKIIDPNPLVSHRFTALENLTNATNPFCVRFFHCTKNNGDDCRKTLSRKFLGTPNGRATTAAAATTALSIQLRGRGISSSCTIHRGPRMFSKRRKSYVVAVVFYTTAKQRSAGISRSVLFHSSRPRHGVYVAGAHARTNTDGRARLKVWSVGSTLSPHSASVEGIRLLLDRVLGKTRAQLA